MSSAAPSVSLIKAVEMDSGEANHKNQLTAEQQAENDPKLPLLRSSSVYSMTLDEIQRTVCEPGKPFGSMNMDELLTNIWNAEEGHAAMASTNEAASAFRLPLQRQTSLSLPEQLSGKTVEQVWADIHGNGGRPSQQNQNGDSGGTAAARQPTLGEMTLEDFLVKAGVVGEELPIPDGLAVAGIPSTPRPVAATPHSDMFGYQMSNAGVVGTGFGGYGDGGMVDGQLAGTGSPSSPESSQGPVDKLAAYGANGVGCKISMGGRKRVADGDVVEKVVDRRHRRMMKNRESAARSRARKQAYTAELETELNQLKEENARLQQHLRVQALRKKLMVDVMAERSRMNFGKRMGMLRRCNTARW